jgi:hypothetical protein
VPRPDRRTINSLSALGRRVPRGACAVAADDLVTAAGIPGRPSLFAPGGRLPLQRVTGFRTIWSWDLRRCVRVVSVRRPAGRDLSTGRQGTGRGGRPRPSQGGRAERLFCQRTNRMPPAVPSSDKTRTGHSRSGSASYSLPIGDQPDFGSWIRANLSRHSSRVRNGLPLTFLIG